MSSLPDTVSILECPNGSRVFLVGTAHFSPSSVEDVKKTINSVRPNSVVLELCKERRNILEVSEDTVRDRSRDLNWEGIRRIMKKEGTVAGLTQVLFIKISAKMMDKLGIVPGGEFRAGFVEGQRNGCTIYLGDREMRVTLKRALNSLPIWQQFKFMKLLASSMLLDMDISLEEVEKMKNADMLEIFTGELAKELPGISKVLIEERDIYLAHHLMHAANCIQEPHGQPQKVVGVVGIGHVNGIKSRWMSNECQSVQELAKIPRPHWSTRTFWGYFGWGFQSLFTFGSVWVTVKIGRFTLRQFVHLLTNFRSFHFAT